MSNFDVQGYMSPKLQARSWADKGGHGVVAIDFIPAGELLVMWAGGIVTGETLCTLDPYQISHSIQVGENQFQIPAKYLDPADLINHSCNPNAGLNSPISLVALRDIVPGEEICFDYATSDSQPYDEFDCLCGAPTCRGRVTGNDWQQTDLQFKYQGFFSPYLQRRIDRLNLLQSLNGSASRQSTMSKGYTGTAGCFELP